MDIKKNKIIITIFIICLSIFFINPLESKAALQSNGGTSATYNIENWLIKIRKMESLGGTFGLNANIDGTTLLDSGDSNNFDSHMELNTEYGAMAILSASPYGNPAKIENGGTTTGNSTGVVININSELVSAGTIRSSSIYQNADGRYKNAYTTEYVAKRGDAIKETKGWHGNKESQWLYCGYYYQEQNNSVLVRAYSGSIFSYYGYAINGRWWMEWNLLSIFIQNKSSCSSRPRLIKVNKKQKIG